MPITKLKRASKFGIFKEVWDLTKLIYMRITIVENRNTPNLTCPATIRISGLPVYKFELEDISGNGTCFLVRDDAEILRHLNIGQEIDIQIPQDSEHKAFISQGSKVINISEQNTAQYSGYRIVSVQVLNRL